MAVQTFGWCFHKMFSVFQTSNLNYLSTCISTMTTTFVGTVELLPALQYCFQRFVATVTVNNIERGRETSLHRKCPS